MDLNSILNVLIQNQTIQKADVPLIGMSSMPQVRVGIVDWAMQLVGNHTHFRTIRKWYEGIALMCRVSYLLRHLCASVLVLRHLLTLFG